MPADPRDPGRKPWIARHVGVLFFAILIVVFAVAEAILWKVRPDLRDPTYFQSPGRPLSAYREDPDLFWEYRSPHSDFDAMLRDAPRRNRVYVFGGSIALGLGNPLFERLRARGLDVAGQNLAAGGWTTHQSVVQQRRYFDLRPPTHAVLCNAFNDAQPAPMTYRAQAERNHGLPRRVLYVLNRSRLFTLYRRALTGAPPANERERRKIAATWPTVCVPLDHYRENVRAFVARCKADGALPILVGQDFPRRASVREVEPYLAVLESVARESGAVWVDVRPAIRAEMARLGIPYQDEDEPRYDRTKDLMWSDVIHPNDHGYALIADLVYEAVDRAGGWNR